MDKRIILPSNFRQRTIPEFYSEIREDIIGILCAMGNICDLQGHQKEYDTLHSALSKNLLLLDAMFQDKLYD